MFLTTGEEAKRFHMKMCYNFCHCSFSHIILKCRPKSSEVAVRTLRLFKALPGQNKCLERFTRVCKGHQIIPPPPKKKKCEILEKCSWLELSYFLFGRYVEDNSLQLEF